jgi:hypothetical protein
MIMRHCVNRHNETRTKGKIMDERRLRKFFHFAENDLLANRRGQFSEDQKKRLSQEAKAEQASARSSAAILFVIAAAGLAVGLTIGSIAPTLVGRVLILLLMGILWPAAWAGKGVQIIRAANVLQEPHLCEVSGAVHIVHHGEGEYTLQVEGLEFDVDRNPAGAVMEGDAYTIYYVEATEEILSIDYAIRGKE